MKTQYYYTPEDTKTELDKFLDTIYERFHIVDLLTQVEVKRRLIDLPYWQFQIWLFFRFMLFAKKIEEEK